MRHSKRGCHLVSFAMGNTRKARTEGFLHKVRHIRIYLFALVGLLLHATSCSRGSTDVRDMGTEELEKRLDYLIENRQGYFEAKYRYADSLYSALSAHGEESNVAYDLSAELYDCYHNNNSDSALKYANICLNMARADGDSATIVKWLFNTASVQSKCGNFDAAKSLLSQTNAKEQDHSTLVEYYVRQWELYCAMIQYTSEEDMAVYPMPAIYRDSAFFAMNESDEYYYAMMGCRFWKFNDPDSVLDVMLEHAKTSDLTSEVNAIEAHTISWMYERKGDVQHRHEYLLRSAIADLQNGSRISESLIDLTDLIWKSGDIRRAGKYYYFILHECQYYGTRPHIVAVCRRLNGISTDYNHYQANLRVRLILLVCFVFLLAVGLLYVLLRIIKLSKRLNNSYKETMVANQKLQELNRKLQEANITKEECIALAFSTYSLYIEKMESFRARINAKVKSKKYAELAELTENNKLFNGEFKQFLQNFDETFLNIYPMFVEDFNALLREEERIVPKNGALLNTDLRIQALMRLGITNSHRISEFLHCSWQTVLNSKSAMRKKSLVQDADFDKAVQKIGYSQHETSSSQNI